MPGYTHKFMTSLPKNLADLKKEIEAYAKGYGLDFYKTIFEVLDWKQLNEVASFGGFPNRYPHWRFGMEYQRLSKSYAYGLSKIYEMVINNDPCYAYLLHSNSIVDQKLVMAHVYAHCDFFKNNIYFAHTNRKMLDEMANHRTRILRYIDQYGYDEVEKFIDSCLSIDNLIDYHAPAIKRKSSAMRPESVRSDRQTPYKFKTRKPYLDSFMNPADFLDEQKKWMDEQSKQEHHFPESPQKDIMLFLLENAPLRAWERDILAMLREEAYYFAPQGQTKIMNEGWAVYFHSKIMTEKALDASEVIDYADHHSGTVATHGQQINPYKLGYELFKDIEDRWNKGKFGKEYDECRNMNERKNWDKKLGKGREKIFEVRRLYNDVTFIDAFLTPEFCAEKRMFVYAYDFSLDQFEIATREFEKIKQKFLFQLTNFGQPIIYVQDGNYKNRGEMLLVHKHEGVDIQMDWASETLKSLYRVWQRPVNIETKLDGVDKIMCFDGKEITEGKA